MLTAQSEAVEREWGDGGVDLSSTCSISLATHCIYEIPLVLSAVDVGEKGEMLTVQLEAVEREWGGGERI
jgi:hypothetical protein